MHIQCTFTDIEQQYLQPSLEENTQFFVEASKKPYEYWSKHAVKLEEGTLKEHPEIYDRLSHSNLIFLFDQLLNSLDNGYHPRLLIAINQIFSANGWDAYAKKASPHLYINYSPNIDFLQFWGVVARKAFWEEHSIYMDRGLLITTVEMSHAPPSAIQAIAKQILSSEEVPTTKKLEVVKGAIAIFEGYEWKFEGPEVLVRCTDSSGTTETVSVPLSIVLRCLMLCNDDMIEEDSTMEEPFFRAPRNTSVIDFKNFASYHAGKRTLDSLSVREWAGVLNIGHHLDFRKYKSSDGIDRVMIRDYLGRCDNLETLDAVFEAIATTLPERVSVSVLQNVLRCRDTGNLEETCKQLTSLRHFEAVKFIPFHYRGFGDFSILKQFFPNSNSW